MGVQRPRPKQRDERGAAAVEFALIVLPLLVILAAIINLGMAFSQQLALDNAVRQAARAAVVDQDADPIAEAEAAFNDAVFAPQGETVDISFGGGPSTCVGSDFGDRMTIEGNFEAKFMFPWLIPGVPDSVNLTSTGEFQCEFA